MPPIDLRHYIRIYDDGLELALCQQMIESFQSLARFQKRNGRGLREGLESSAWTELNVTRLSDQSFLEMFRARISEEMGPCLRRGDDENGSSPALAGFASSSPRT